MKPYYDDGLITLYHGDCRDVLGSLRPDPSTTIALTDPPWPGPDVPIVGGGAAAVPLWRQVAAMVPAFASRLILHLSCLTDTRGMVGAVPTSLPFATACWLRYIPPPYRGCFMHAADVAYVFGKQRLNEGTKILPAESVSAAWQRRYHTEHPCPRNLDHLLWLVRWYTAKSALIIDPFAGTGTTLVACALVGKRCVGIEIEERWCAEAVTRIREARAQQRLVLGST